MDDKQFNELKLFINNIVEKKIATSEMHKKTFTQFRNIHTGRDIVLVATGPSSRRYIGHEIPGAIHFGVNRAIDMGIPLDYLMIQDISGAWDYIDRINKYRPGLCTKFYGLTTEWTPQRVVPESDAVIAGAYRYRTDWENIPGYQPKPFEYYIESASLSCRGSVTFPALQVISAMNPKRIYLVGCDCSRDGYFDKNQTNGNFLRTDAIIESYKVFKEFNKTYYRNTEIISVNPIGLKGIFKDIVI